MSNNRKNNPNTKPPVKKPRKAKRESRRPLLNGFTAKMYIGASGICCKIDIHKHRFIEKLLESEDSNGYVTIHLFPTREVTNNGVTHYPFITCDKDYESESDRVSKRVKELGL